MSRNAVKSALAAAVCAASLALAAGCGGGEEGTHVVEGEPVELAGQSFNVQITRFLNKNDTEDAAYLVGQPEAPAGQVYLGVFMQIENENDEDVELPTAAGLEVTDTTGEVFRPLPSDSPFALDLGGTLPGDSSIPAPDTIASYGPTQGSLLIYLITVDAAENRPLELTIRAHSPDGEVEEGVVELDI